MENDDLPVGKILSRREALKVLGLGSAAFLAACADPQGTTVRSYQRRGQHRSRQRR